MKKKRGRKIIHDINKMRFPVPVDELRYKNLNTWVCKMRKKGYPLLIMQDDNGKKYLCMAKKSILSI